MPLVEKLLRSAKIKPHNFERFLKKSKVQITNKVLNQCITMRRKEFNISTLPFENYNYMNALNKNCENIIGYTRIPTGIIGPVKFCNNENYVPFATTEGALVSSINRGVKLLNMSETNVIVEDVGMTRAPIVKCPSITEVKNLKEWIRSNFEVIKQIFEMESNHTKLQEITFLQEGQHLHIRFRATTGEAMGMNMVGKGTNFVLRYLKKQFENMDIVTLSGNTCTDKKANAINWITGRGKHVVMEANISTENLRKVMKVSPPELANLNLQKNMVGSSLAATIGGNNCNTSNVLAGIFLATGQDSGQIGTSSSSILNLIDNTKSLTATLTMPCLELGSIGGGTTLEDQKSNIDLICGDAENRVERLAQNIIYCIMGCELSLLSSLCNNDLVQAHMKFNRGL
jgi:hydroxymethylglutaryl-CoA reductase (NADPH)